MSRDRRMPLRTRLFTSAFDRLSARSPMRDWSPARFEAMRAQVPPTFPPASWITGAVAPQVRQEDVLVPARDGHRIPVRIQRPPEAGEHAPVVLYLHGGGFTLGSPRQYDPLTSFLADELGAVVVAPDYRKAPQHQAPTAVLDCEDVLRWLVGHPDQVGTDGPVALAGDSAGGNLSAVLTLRARDDGGPRIAGQALLYPAVDMTQSSPSASARDGAILSGDSMDVFLDAYLGGSGIDASDPVVSPMLADSHADLPPALVQTAELDPLRDEGERYAQLLDDAGVPTRLTRYAGMPHGFHSFPGATPVGTQARAELVQSLRSWLEPRTGSA